MACNILKTYNTFMFSRTQRCGCFYVGVLVNVIKMRYTYDSLGRVTNRTVLSECDCVISSEDYTHDAAGNITDAPDSCFQYDINNRLEVFNCNCVSYDMDGNMLSNGEQCFTYDSANRLITADCHTYTYNAEDVRIRNLCERCEDTAYTYDTNCKLSKLLCKTTNGVATKYVYGRGLVGEEVCGTFKTYHFDCRGSTIAITDTSGNITDTFVYDTYGKLVSRTGTSEVIFGHNGRDGVVTDDNGLIYMRARYYSPEMKRFINADIVAGQISNAVTLNRFAYANGNPVSFVDPFGLSADRGGTYSYTNNWFMQSSVYFELIENQANFWGNIFDFSSPFKETSDLIYKFSLHKLQSAKKPKRTPQGSWILKNRRQLSYLDETFGSTSKLTKGLKGAGKALDVAGKFADGAVIFFDTASGISENIASGTRTQKIVSDALVDVGTGVGIAAGSTAVGAWAGSFIPIPVVGTLFGAGVGYVVGEGAEFFIEYDIVGDKSLLDLTKDGAGWVADRVVDAGEWIADTAPDVWDAATDFVEDTGEDIGDFFEDAGDAAGRFFEDVGGFFSGLFA